MDPIQALLAALAEKQEMEGSGTALARRLGLSQNYLSELTNGVRPVTPRLCMATAIAYPQLKDVADAAFLALQRPRRSNHTTATVEAQ